MSEEQVGEEQAGNEGRPEDRRSQVTLLTGLAGINAQGVNYTHQPGETITVPSAEAERLVAKGYAEAVGESRTATKKGGRKAVKTDG